RCVARAPAHRPDPCRGRGGRGPLPGDALRRGSRPGRAAPQSGAARSRADDRPARPGRLGARHGAHTRARASRREAGKHPRLAHVNDPPPSVTDRRPELPGALDEVVATALAKDRDLRYSSCSELVVAARAALHGEAPAAPKRPATAAPGIRTFLFADVRGYTT